MASDAAPTYFPLQPSDLTIWHRDEKGRADWPYPPNDLFRKWILECINIARDMLVQPKVKLAFVNLAQKHSEAQPKSWYLRNPTPNDHIKFVTDLFLKKILARFPLVFVDYTIKNPSYLGTHLRREWDGDFDPRHQSIQINGTRTGHMVGAASKAGGKRQGDSAKKELQIFLFTFSNVFLHETSHVFITFLTKGREDTPPHINMPMIGYSEESEEFGDPQGEAGLSVEVELFGGILEFYCHPVHGTNPNQPEVPYLRTEDANELKLIPIAQESIDETVRHQFEFPYRTSQDPDDGAIARDHLRTLGFGMEPDHPTDPLDYEEMEHLRGPGPANA